MGTQLESQEKAAKGLQSEVEALQATVRVLQDEKREMQREAESQREKMKTAEHEVLQTALETRKALATFQQDWHAEVERQREKSMVELRSGLDAQRELLEGLVPVNGERRLCDVESGQQKFITKLQKSQQEWQSGMERLRENSRVELQNGLDAQRVTFEGLVPVDGGKRLSDIESGQEKLSAELQGAKQAWQEEVERLRGESRVELRHGLDAQRAILERLVQEDGEARLSDVENGQQKFVAELQSAREVSQAEVERLRETSRGELESGLDAQRTALLEKFRTELQSGLDTQRAALLEMLRGEIARDLGGLRGELGQELAGLKLDASSRGRDAEAAKELGRGAEAVAERLAVALLGAGALLGCCQATAIAGGPLAGLRAVAVPLVAAGATYCCTRRDGDPTSRAQAAERLRSYVFESLVPKARTAAASCAVTSKAAEAAAGAASMLSRAEGAGTAMLSRTEAAGAVMLSRASQVTTVAYDHGQRHWKRARDFVDEVKRQSSKRRRMGSENVDPEKESPRKRPRQ